MKKSFFLFSLLIVGGCVSLPFNTPGTINERISGFDKSKEIIMEPAWLISESSAPIKFGLYKTSKMNEDQVVLVVVVRGAYNFADKESLQFNIDGQTISFEPMDRLTDIETKEGVQEAYLSAYNESSKRYLIDKSMIRKLLDAKEVWVKVNLSKGYVEGEFSKDGQYIARPAFKEFYNKVWHTNKEEK